MVPTNESGERERRPGLCIAERGIENNPVMIYTELQCCVHKTRNNTFDIDNIEELGKFFLDLAFIIYLTFLCMQEMQDRFTLLAMVDFI